MKTKTKDDIFKTVQTLSGDKIDVSFCRGWNVLKIQLAQVIGDESMHPAEISIMLMIDLCTVGGKSKIENSI